MRGWIVLAAVLLLLFLLGQLRLGAVGEYGRRRRRSLVPGGACPHPPLPKEALRAFEKGEGAQAREGAPCGGGTRRRTFGADEGAAAPGLGGGGLFPPQAAGGSAGAEAHHRRGGPRRRSYPIWTGQRPAGKHLAAPDRGVPCGGGPGSGRGGLRPRRPRC